ncbi:hypothetical protein TNIN_78901 [Trichonephila inaurata madagascariensis]|uniref:Uncharacterized protein n=1 Tax=Trichonephila inaurata madagascariensis TaxID=2747483 RepID=A0A8X7C8C9_9ARAC|nr:hypothetical protein TNIN_78901 [Trichonephila inaurata madagascariensis]
MIRSYGPEVERFISPHYFWHSFLSGGLTLKLERTGAVEGCFCLTGLFRGSLVSAKHAGKLSCSEVDMRVLRVRLHQKRIEY